MEHLVSLIGASVQREVIHDLAVCLGEGVGNFALQPYVDLVQHCLRGIEVVLCAPVSRAHLIPGKGQKHQHARQNRDKRDNDDDHHHSAAPVAQPSLFSLIRIPHTIRLPSNREISNQCGECRFSGILLRET